MNNIKHQEPNCQFEGTPADAHEAKLDLVKIMVQLVKSAFITAGQGQEYYDHPPILISDDVQKSDKEIFSNNYCALGKCAMIKT